MGPEGSRRARALRDLGDAARLRARGLPRRWSSATSSSRSTSPPGSTREPELERLAEAPLNIVCFRWHPQGAAEDELDELNRGLGEALLRDGRVFAGTTVFEGKVAFRPAIVNWRTRAEDVDALVDVLLELASDLRS